MRTSLVLFFIGYLIIMVSFNNCSATHQSDASLSSFEACNLILKDEFARGGYHDFLKTNCASCHYRGGTGNGAFGDADVARAFDAFVVRGNILVGSRALDPNHQPPFTGAQHNDEVSQLDSTWDVAKLQADQCVAANGGQQQIGIEEGVIPEDPVPTTGTVRTFVKLLQADKDAKTISWNLENEISQPRSLSFPGARLEISVAAATTVTGEKSYIFSNPRLIAGQQSIHIMFIEFYINNQLVRDATSWHTINRRIPAGQTRDIGVGGVTFLYDLKSTDVISLSIGVLEAINFDPPRFADLIAPGGVFNANCMSCHDGASGNPSGGFDISTRNAVLQQLMVAPYSPNNSMIFKRMNDAQRPMPQSGLLPAADIEQVLWWIQDGAL